MTRYEIPDDYDGVVFEGTLMARAHTRRGGQPRWTELVLYRTEGDQYVISKIGRSIVYHQPDSACNTGVRTTVLALCERVEELAKLIDPNFNDEALYPEPCEKCRPPRIYDTDSPLDDNDVVDAELDRPQAEVCAPADVPERLRLRRNDGPGPSTSFMSSVATRVLATAAANDPLLRQAIRHIRQVS